MYNTASKLYNNLLGIYFDEYYGLAEAKRKKLESKYEPDKLFLEAYNYDVWCENQESSDREELTDKNESTDLHLKQ